MKYLIALIVAASLPIFGTESTNAPVKAELDNVPEAQPAASTAQIAQRLRRNGNGWLLNENDREKLPITITNEWNGKVCAGPVVSELAPHGLLLEHESGAFWCSWARLPPETRDKYLPIATAAQAQRNNSSKTSVGESVYQPPTSTRADDSTGKTVHVRGYTRKDGTYVAPYDRRAPREDNTPETSASNSVPVDQPSTPSVNQSPSSTSADDSTGKTVHVNGYTKKNGTYVAPYNRSAPHRK